MAFTLFYISFQTQHLDCWSDWIKDLKDTKLAFLICGIFYFVYEIYKFYTKYTKWWTAVHFKQQLVILNQFTTLEKKHEKQQLFNMTEDFPCTSGQWRHPITSIRNFSEDKVVKRHKNRTLTKSPLLAQTNQNNLLLPWQPYCCLFDVGDRGRRNISVAFTQMIFTWHTFCWHNPPA